jgi:hypothetical protein
MVDGNLEGSEFHDDPGLDDALQPLAVTQQPGPDRPSTSILSPIFTLSLLSSSHRKIPMRRRKEQHANKEFIACLYPWFQGRRPHI